MLAQEYDEDEIYDQNSMDNNLSPLPSSSQLLNWNDYGYALVSMSASNQPTSNERPLPPSTIGQADSNNNNNNHLRRT